MNLTQYKITHLPKPHGKNAFAWGITEERQGKKELLACMETCPERQYELLRITKLWVHEKLRRNETEHDLLEIAKEQAFLERRRAVIVEVRSDDPESIHFYEQEGFKQISFNNERYLKSDFLTLGYILKKNPRLPGSAIEIRQEKKSEYHKTEEVALRAFWNKHYPGCNLLSTARI